MKTVEPRYEIWQMPDGEEALALLERIGRIAYKSEDKIDDGREECECGGDAAEPPHYVECPKCKGKGWIQAREPSSHAFIRMILKAERNAKLVILAKKILEEHQEHWFVEKQDELCDTLVNNIVEYMEDNPAHESVIEHCSATVWFCSNRGFTHELVRHRVAAYTQESTRYCNYIKGKFGGEIAVCPDRRPELSPENAKLWEAGNLAAEQSYLGMVGGHDKVKPQIARDVLPQVTKAEIACTANFREWRHIFRMRDSKNAHPDMQTLMDPLHVDFRRQIPIIFD